MIKKLFYAFLLNLFLFILIPRQVLQFIVAMLVRSVCFIFGTHSGMEFIQGGVKLVSQNGSIGIMQYFLEIYTLISLTIVLDTKNGAKKAGVITGIVILYYTIIYSITFILYDRGINASFMTRFLQMNSTYLMFFLFLGLWTYINWRELKKYLN